MGHPAPREGVPASYEVGYFIPFLAALTCRVAKPSTKGDTDLGELMRPARMRVLALRGSGERSGSRG